MGAFARAITAFLDPPGDRGRDLRGRRAIVAAMRTLRLRIAGRVQGVGYRAWAIRVAGELGLRGWVRNRSDGSVEMLATGPNDALVAMIEASRQGPRAAEVLDVAVADAEPDGSAGFGARPTE